MKNESLNDGSLLNGGAKTEAAAEMLEAEQHAIEPLRHLFDVSRRDLFKLLGAGLVVGVCAQSGLAQESGRPLSENVPSDLASWLHIGEDGKVTVFTGKVEIGQNIRTSLAQQVAEELHVPMTSITLIMGDTDLTPFDMGTFGSRSTPQMGTRLRTVAASAREALVDLAAQHWKADRATLAAQNGAVVNSKSGQSISYGELTRGQKLVKVAVDGAIAHRSRAVARRREDRGQSRRQGIRHRRAPVHIRHDSSGDAARESISASGARFPAGLRGHEESREAGQRNRGA